MKRGKPRNKNNNLKKTILITIFSSIIFSLLAVYIQINGQKSNNGCSYLDPITIDLLAFIAGLFLVVEGFARIIENKDALLKQQFSRMVRVAGGFAIMTLHVMQFLHK
ncbi:MAG: hypothetical protein RL557_904 [archaeon]|jgi:hypothetical protein